MYVTFNMQYLTQIKTMNKSKINTMFEYEFRRGTTAAQTVHNVNNVLRKASLIK